MEKKNNKKKVIPFILIEIEIAFQESHKYPTITKKKSQILTVEGHNVGRAPLGGIQSHIFYLCGLLLNPPLT